MLKKQTIIITKENSNLRIDKALKNVLEDVSRNSLTIFMQEGKIKVNGNIVKPSYISKENDIITIEEIENKEIDVIPQDLNLDIVYEDEYVCVVDKPKNMVVHPAIGSYDNTLVNGLLHQIDDLSGINGVLRPGIVHRIDKDTSGLLMIAKNDIAHVSLSEQLKNHTVNRIYVALVYGKMKAMSGRIETPIGRDKKDRKKMAVVPNGKNAITNFTVIKSYDKFTLIECKLETGRTHQIRVHLNYIGHPIVGDKVYGPRKVIVDDGQLLHAKTLGFIHPKTNEYIEFTSKIPKTFTDFLNNLEE